MADPVSLVAKVLDFLGKFIWPSAAAAIFTLCVSFWGPTTWVDSLAPYRLLASVASVFFSIAGLIHSGNWAYEEFFQKRLSNWLLHSQERKIETKKVFSFFVVIKAR